MGKLPVFLNYNSEDKRKDSGYEAIQDFFLSWTIRCAAEKYAQENPIVHKYAKKILTKLIFEKSLNNLNMLIDPTLINKLSFTKIKTHRQHSKIDLVVEIEYTYEDESKSVVLSIENKWYTQTSLDQLSRYSSIVETDFSSKFFHVEKILIFCDETLIKSHQKEIAAQHSYKIFHIGELFDRNKENRTGNELFDSYWFTDFGRSENDIPIKSS